MRLNKYLALCGVGSRRASDKVIAEKRVTVNGKKVLQLGTLVDENKDIVRVDGKSVKSVRRRIYVLLNKPKGVVTTLKDERGRKTVLDLIDIKERLFAVGRLDAGSEGLLLLTNDGEMAHRLMHPRFKVSKTYRIRLDRGFNADDFKPLTTGVELEDGVTAPCKACFYTDSFDRIEISLREGRNRQIRRMLEALGYRVRTLKRIQFGPLFLKGVARGKWRYLANSEIRQLRNATKLLKR
ncbi:MAG: pseudouridine synthase [Actinobacteria bacterium]|nr:pseudouridine synthase [Actinomycetota bacterium]